MQESHHLPDHDLEFLRDFFEHAPDMFVSVDARTGKVRDCNATVVETLGWPRERIVGHPVQELYHPDCAEQVATTLRQFRDTGSATAEQLFLKRADGSRLPVSLRVSAVRDQDGTILYSRSIWRDLSLQHEVDSLRLEADLQKAQRLESLAVLAGGIAHDFNNILTGILGNAGLALLSMPADAAHRPMLEEIERASLRASELTHQMLAYSGGGPFRVEPLCMSELARDMIKLLEAGLPKNARIERELADPGPVCEVDGTQIRQVVMNLVTNGAQALEDGSGTVRVRTGTREVTSAQLANMIHGETLSTGEYAFLEVSDDGCGMSNDVVERMFDPFFTTKANGHGLGLAAMLGIIQSHHGAVGVASEPGDGTVVTVLLPATDQCPETRQPTRPRQHTGGTILVVDDEPQVGTFAERLLQRAGYEVMLAQNGSDGIELFRDHADELRAVLLDLTMPDVDGREVLRQMHEIDEDACVILMSGYDKHGIANASGAQPPAAFLRKPFQTTELLDLLAIQLEGRPARPR